MAKPRRAPNKTEKLAAVLLLIKRGDQWLVPEPIRTAGTADQIVASVVWHHDVPYAVRPHNDPRLLTPLRPDVHDARFRRDMGEIARVRRGVKKRAGTKRKKPPMAGSKASRWKKHMDGSVSLR